LPQPIDLQYCNAFFSASFLLARPCEVPNANLASFGLTAIATAEAALIDEMAAIVQSKTAPIVKPHRNLRWRRIIERARFIMIAAHYQLFRPILSTLLSELVASAGWSSALLLAITHHPKGPIKRQQSEAIGVRATYRYCRASGKRNLLLLSESGGL
jgi:hypothetical protein